MFTGFFWSIVYSKKYLYFHQASLIFGKTFLFLFQGWRNIHYTKQFQERHYLESKDGWMGHLTCRRHQ